MRTFKRFKQEFYSPIIEERDNFDSWSRNGSMTMTQRATAKYKEILKNYQEPAMDDTVRKELDTYINMIRNA